MPVVVGDDNASAVIMRVVLLLVRCELIKKQMRGEVYRQTFSKR